jgi:CHRD domain
LKMKVYRYGWALFLLAILASPARAVNWDVCIDPTKDFRLDDIDGNGALSTGDGISAVGMIVVDGTIPQGGVSSCSAIAGAKIGTFFAQGRVTAGFPQAATNDVAYVDWHLDFPTLGAIDTTGLVKTTSTFPQTITGATGLLGSARGQALTQVLDASGFQIRIIVPSVQDPLQGIFHATLTGSQETPPVETQASGTATLKLNADKTLSYEVVTAGPITAFAAHIHRAPPGVPGPILFPLAGGPRVWIGTTPPLTVEQQAALINGELYVNAHTDDHPAGEIRGQIMFVGE